ncbi:unnamed protein product, partial [Sphacelaria rigidula]
LHGASAWFKEQVQSQRRGHQYREELLLRGLAVSIEPLEDSAAASGEFARYGNSSGSFTGRDGQNNNTSSSSSGNNS